MKIVSIIVFSVILSNLFARDVSTEKLYSKILFEEITVTDKDGKIITSSEIFNHLFFVDTTINCFGGHSKFQDLKYSFDIESNVRPAEIQHFKKSNRKGYEIFKLNSNPETGAITEKQYLFDIETKDIGQINKVLPSSSDNNLVNSKHDIWKIVKFEIDSRSPEIDSCLSEYYLQFFDSSRFNHSYKLGNRCGNPNESEEDYYHMLSYLKGYWKTIGNKLILVNHNYEKPIMWDYKINVETLELSLGEKYIIALEKQPIIIKK